MRIRIYLKILLLFVFTFPFHTNLKGNNEFEVKRVHHGNVLIDSDSTYRILKTKSYSIDELRMKINFLSIQNYNDSLKLTFSCQFSLITLTDFELYNFKELVNTKIDLEFLKYCSNNKGRFSLIIPSDKREVKIVVKHQNYGIYYSIYSIE